MILYNINKRIRIRKHTHTRTHTHTHTHTHTCGINLLSEIFFIEVQIRMVIFIIMYDKSKLHTVIGSSSQKKFSFFFFSLQKFTFFAFIFQRITVYIFFQGFRMGGVRVGYFQVQLFLKFGFKWKYTLIKKGGKSA